MPYFYSEAEIDVSVREFLDECCEEEIEDVIKYLRKNGYLKKSNDDSSYLESTFQNNIQKLSENRLSLSNEEIQTIESIAQRFI